jgi:hypothetical protein
MLREGMREVEGSQNFANLWDAKWLWPSGVCRGLGANQQMMTLQSGKEDKMLDKLFYHVAK